MINNLLWVGWPSASKKIVGTFRLADSYTVPPPYTTPGPEMTPIFTDTAVNATHWTHTFICKNCHKWLLSDGYEQSFDLTGDFAVMGYAGHTEAIPDDPEDPTSDVQQHNFFGQFGMMLGEARSANYAQWRAAGLAKPDTTSTVTATPTPTPTPTSTPRPTTTATTPWPLEPPQPSQGTVQKWSQWFVSQTFPFMECN